MIIHIKSNDMKVTSKTNNFMYIREEHTHTHKPSYSNMILFSLSWT